MSRDTPTKTEEAIGTLMPFSAFYDPIFGFRMDAFSTYMRESSEILITQNKTKVTPQQKRYASTSKYIR